MVAGRKESVHEDDYRSILHLLAVIRDVVPTNAKEWNIVEKKFNTWSVNNGQSMRTKASLKKQYQCLQRETLSKEVSSMISQKEAMMIAVGSDEIPPNQLDDENWPLVECGTKPCKQRRKNYEQRSPKDTRLKRLVFQQREKLDQVQTQVMILTQVSIQVQQRLRDVEESRQRFTDAIIALKSDDDKLKRLRKLSLEISDTHQDGEPPIDPSLPYYSMFDDPHPSTFPLPPSIPPPPDTPPTSPPPYYLS